VWLARLKGINIKKRVSGADLMENFFALSSKEGFSNYFYGDTTETLEELNKKLLLKFPNLKIVGSYSPPFRKLTEKEDEEIINKINIAKKLKIKLVKV
jgi:N-acetylglucosaminyldiphosphoundecaprenol N-acetyl-beta-D-mannosaminyltransferase